MFEDHEKRIGAVLANLKTVIDDAEKVGLRVRLFMDKNGVTIESLRVQMTKQTEISP